MKHTESHPLAGQTVKVVLKADHPQLQGLEHEYRIEDWWDLLTGQSWMFSHGNPACIIYAIRTGLKPGAVPTDDEVVYGKIGNFGHLIHVSELVTEDAEVSVEPDSVLTEGV